MSSKILFSFSLIICLFGFGCAKQIISDDETISPEDISLPSTPIETEEQTISSGLPKFSIDSFEVSSIDTENWKTHANEVCGFSFKYPNDWTIFTDNKISTAVASPETVEDLKFFFESDREDKTAPPPKSFDFSASCLPDIKTFIDQHDKNLPDSTLGSITNLSEYIDLHINHPLGPLISLLGQATLGEQTAYEIGLAGHSVRFAFWIEYRQLYELILPDIENTDQLSPTQQQILDSFVFTK